MSDSRARSFDVDGNMTLLAGGFSPSAGSLAESNLVVEDSREETPLARPNFMYVTAKRAMDILIAMAAIIVFGLVMPIIALIIKLDSPGPVFYSQDRVGHNRRATFRGAGDRERRKVSQPGRPFHVHKLRTMRVNAEANGPQLAAENDSRITRVGRFLRKTRIDEIPQFWNILKGEMSLIGPRPERLVFVRQLEKEIPASGKPPFQSMAGQLQPIQYQYCLMAQPWLVLRTQAEPLGVAKGKDIPDC